MLRSLVCSFVAADSIYNLREENKQLRKAHHDIHTQLQDAQVRPDLWHNPDSGTVKLNPLKIKKPPFFSIRSVTRT